MKMQLIATGAMLLLVAAYVTFLVMIWNQYQADRGNQQTKIDELLDRLPQKEAPKEA